MIMPMTSPNMPSTLDEPAVNHDQAVWVITPLY